jgi:hypothetical protein
MIVTHIFGGTYFALWKNHMLDHVRAKGPKFWCVVTSGLTHVLDHKNLTKAQKVLFELDFDAYLFLMDALSFELFYKVNHKRTSHELWESIKHTFGDSSTWDDGKFKKEDEPKVEAHECVEHDHNLVIVEDCSTSWSSDDDDRSTTSSLDKIDDDAISDANDDVTPCTLGGDDDGSYSDDIATTSPSITPHCFKVKQRYQILMWLIMLIHMMSLLVDLLA